jgi:hypothetical protein
MIAEPVRSRVPLPAVELVLVVVIATASLVKNSLD